VDRWREGASEVEEKETDGAVVRSILREEQKSCLNRHLLNVKKLDKLKITSPDVRTRLSPITLSLTLAPFFNNVCLFGRRLQRDWMTGASWGRSYFMS